MLGTKLDPKSQHLRERAATNYTLLKRKSVGGCLSFAHTGHKSLRRGCLTRDILWTAVIDVSPQKQSSSIRYRMELPEKNAYFEKLLWVLLTAAINQSRTNCGQAQQRERARLWHDGEHEGARRDNVVIHEVLVGHFRDTRADDCRTQGVSARRSTRSDHERNVSDVVGVGVDEGQRLGGRAEVVAFTHEAR